VRSTSQKIPSGRQFCQLNRFIKPSGQQFYSRDHVFATSSNQALLEIGKGGYGHRRPEEQNGFKLSRFLGEESGHLPAPNRENAANNLSLPKSASQSSDKPANRRNKENLQKKVADS
jgi:hypothetical protein